MTFQPGDRIEMYPDWTDPLRADVLKVSKKGDRLYIEHWGRGFQSGKLVRQWTDASGATLVRRRG